MILVLVGCKKADPATTVVGDEPDDGGQAQVSPEQENQAKLQSWLRYIKNQDPKKQQEAIDELVKFETDYGVPVVPSLVVGGSTEVAVCVVVGGALVEVMVAPALVLPPLSPHASGRSSARGSAER